MEWRAHLARFVARSRARKPIPSRASLSLAEEHQCRIIGGALLAWLESNGPAAIADRNAHARAMPFAFKPLTSPTIVLILDRPGLVAAAEILADKPPNIFFLESSPFQRFKRSHPDDEFDHHIVYRSCFLPEPTQLEQYPLMEGEEFWIHEESTTLGPLSGRGVQHLWKWDGHQPTLLEEGFGGWIS